MVHDYAVECGINSEGNPIGVHSMRATACTNALDNEADLRRVKQWMGHAHISTTDPWVLEGLMTAEVQCARCGKPGQLKSITGDFGGDLGHGKVDVPLCQLCEGLLAVQNPDFMRWLVDYLREARSR
jgi:integrase-like protein